MAGGGDDAALLVELSDEDFTWMLGGHPHRERALTLPPGGVDEPEILGHVRAITRRLHAARNRTSWMIVVEGEVVGLCGFKYPLEYGEVEIGYGIAASRRMRGYATRAVGAMLRKARDIGANSVAAETVIGNAASARVLEKNGFRKTGTRVDPLDGEVIAWRRTLEPGEGP